MCRKVQSTKTHANEKKTGHLFASPFSPKPVGADGVKKNPRRVSRGGCSSFSLVSRVRQALVLIFAAHGGFQVSVFF